MRRLPRSKPPSKIFRASSPIRSSQDSPSTPRGPRTDGEGKQIFHRPGGRPAEPQDPFLFVPWPRRSPVPRIRGAAAGRTGGCEVRCFDGRGESEPVAAGRRSRGVEPVRRAAPDLGRTCRKRPRGGGRSAARGGGGRKPGRGDRRRVAEELALTQARRNF